MDITTGRMNVIRIALSMGVFASVTAIVKTTKLPLMMDDVE
jgi:hypothetical protein